MAQGVNTLPYVYLRCEEADNQATKSLDDVVHSHEHEVVPSRVLAKIPRTVDNRQGIFYRTTFDTPFFTNITANYINNLIFQITDHRGRPIQPVLPENYPNSQSPAGTNVASPPSGTIQNKDGNLYCDFAFKITKLPRKNVAQILQTQPPQIGDRNERIMFSGVIPNAVDFR